MEAAVQVIPNVARAPNLLIRPATADDAEELVRANEAAWDAGMAQVSDKKLGEPSTARRGRACSISGSFDTGACSTGDRLSGVIPEHWPRRRSLRPDQSRDDGD